MTAKELSQYKSAKAEIKSIHKELQELPDYIEGTDTVKGSSPEYPYTEHPVTIRGLIPNPRKENLQKRLMRLERIVSEVDAFLDGIEDVCVLRAIRVHFFEGLTWTETAFELEYAKGGEPLRKLVKHLKIFFRNSAFSVFSVFGMLEL